MGLIFIGNLKSPLAVERFKMLSIIGVEKIYFYDRASMKFYDKDFRILFFLKFIKFNHVISFLFLIFLVVKYRVNNIHFHGVSVQLLSLISFFNINIIATPQGSDINQNFKGKHAFFTKILLNKASIVTAKSIAMMERIKNICNNENIILLNWGVNDSYSRNMIENRNDDIYIVSPRTNKDNYNIDLIFNAISIVKKKFSNIKFIYISLHKTNYGNLNLSLADEVYYGLKTEDMKKIYLRSDLMISIPSNDGFSTSIMEASLCGCLPIISNLKAYNDLESSYKGVLKIDNPYDLELAKYIEKCVLDIDKIRSLINCRKNIANQLYSKEKQYEILKKIYLV